MKGNVLGALLVSVCLTGQSFGAGLMDRMLGNGCGCDSCEASCCCEKSCGCPDDCCGNDACCEASCGCEDTCCDNGCGRRCCILDRLFGGRHKHSCCEAACGCDDGCCGDDACCEEASCGCPDDCCEDSCCDNGCGKRRCCILGRLFGRKNSCCEASCGCEDSCCEASCGCASGGCNSCAPAADAPAGGEAAPMPPAPVADPAAKLGQPRKVVSASFVR